MSRSLYARLARRHGNAPLPTRRDLLRAAFASSAALAAAACGAGRTRARRGFASSRAIVVGGGFAGLAAADALAAAGVDVIVLEARACVGGRVLSFHDFVPGKVVEGGGELIGSNHPLWCGYAARFGLPFRDVGEEEDLEASIVLDGARLTADESLALYTEMTAAIATLNADALHVQADEPWLSARALELDRRTCRDWIDELDVSRRCARAFDVQLTADDGVETHAQSYLALLAMVKGGGLDAFWTDSEVYRCAGGNQLLAEHLARAIGPERVRRSAVVTEVRSDETRVRVRCADGATFEADDVVLATPPPTWARIVFDPPLPQALAPQLGDSVKYLASVDRRFWRDARRAPDALTDGDVAMLWESTDAQAGDEGAGLCAFSSGPAAAACRAREGARRRTAYVEAIEPLVPGFERALVADRFMDWRSDAATGCGYAFPAPGEVTTVAPLWRQPQGRVHFAGEHTSTRFPGYMEGALESGVRVASAITASGR